MKRLGRPAFLVGPAVLAFALRALAVMHDDDIPGPEPTDLCVEPVVGVVGTPYLNGLPVIQQSLEILGEQVKVVVETTPRCHEVTPSSLPFEWQITGPSGPVTPADAGTLRPHFQPLVAGAKELGLVSQVFNEATLATLQGDLGIGHVRYSTTGSTTWENAQPAFKTDGHRGHVSSLFSGRDFRRQPAPDDYVVPAIERNRTHEPATAAAARCRAAVRPGLVARRRGRRAVRRAARRHHLGMPPHPRLRPRSRFAAAELLDRRSRGDLHLLAHPLRAAALAA